MLSRENAPTLFRSFSAATFAVLLLAGAPAQAQETCTGDNASANYITGEIGSEAVAMHWTSGLVWKRCMGGQSWNAGTQTCEGTFEIRRWNEWMDEYMPRSFEGEDAWWAPIASPSYTPDSAAGPVGVDRLRNGQWRMPYQLELAGLTTGCENVPKINREAFPATPSSNVWSGSPYAGSSNSAWLVDFYNGIAHNSSRGVNGLVRLVRGGQSFAALPSPVTRIAEAGTEVTFTPLILMRSEDIGMAWGGVRITGQGNPQFQVNGGGWVSEAVVRSGDQITVRMIAGAAGSAREAVLTLRSGEITPTAANATNGGDEATVLRETSSTFLVNVASAQPGLCGSANGAASLSAPASGLCAAGSPTAVTSGFAAFTWSCNGVNGGQDMYCSAPRQHEVSTLPGGSGGSVSPTSRVVLVGGEARFDVSAEPGQALETIEGCGGTLIGDEFVIERVIEACTVTASFVPVAAGACGPAAGQPSLMAPASGLCAAGMASAVTSTNGGHAWQCAGSGGATGAYCSAPGLNTALEGGSGGSGEANITLTLDDETTCTLREAAVIEPPEGGPDDVEMSYGALSFTLENCGVGGSATVTVSYSGDENGVAYWKYVNDQWVTIPAALSSTFTLTDGGPFDADGETNGVIVDPGGPGVRRRASSVPVEHVIDAQAQPAEGGSVECVPNPVPDGGDASCTAISQAGYTFSYWSGDCEGMGGCDLASVGGALSVTAHFSVEDGGAGGPYAVTTTAAPVDGGHVLCTPNPVPHGGSATCTATPAAGFNFASWGGACSGSGVCTLSNVTVAQSVSASFTAPPPPPPPVVTYTVTAAASPAAGGTASCTPLIVSSGGASTCTATANPGYRFTGWSGDCTGTDVTCTLTDITADRSVTAGFASRTELDLPLPEGTQSGQTLHVAAMGGEWYFDEANTRTHTGASVGEALPAGATLPHGVVSLRLIGGTPGSSATVVLTYPEALPAGTRYYKYGPTAANPAAHWYEYPHAAINGNTITLTLTDGGAGDSDLEANGVIVDPGGPAQVADDVAPDVTPIPTLSQWATLLLAGLMGLLAFGRLRRLPHA